MYTIYPIVTGILTSTKEALTYRVDAGLEISFPVLSFLLVPTDTSNVPTVLVDTGVKASDSAYMKRQDRKVGPPGGGPDPLRSGLNRQGLTPTDVDTVILTHLHHDHSANNDLFDSAEFFVQRSELDAARDPLPVFERSYPRDSVESLSDLDLTLLDGDHRITDGLEILVTPGHSPGMQSVIVETGGRRYALVGDLAYLRHNLDPSLTSLADATGTTLDITPTDADYIPPGTHTNVPACYESIERIRKVIGHTGVIVPSHDPTVVDQTYPASN